MKKTCFFTPLSAILNIKGRKADLQSRILERKRG
jgi:hypothetical protein